jgi:Tol biopolymer transport system component
MNADGSDQKQIVRSGTRLSDYLPAWSRDGQLILFSQRCVTSFCLPYAMKISSTDRSVQQGTLLQSSTLSVENLEYSQDGFWIVYEGDATGQNNDIFYMTVTGASRTRLTFDEGLDFDPTWRPSIQ